MTHAEAISAIISEARSERYVTTTAARRIVRAAKALNVDPIIVLSHLEFCDADGNPYSERIKRVW